MALIPLFSTVQPPSSIVDSLNTLINSLNTSVTFAGLPQSSQSASCTTALSRTSSTALTDVVGLSIPVVAGGRYIFRAYLEGTSGATGGAKFAISGTATWTSFQARAKNYNGTTLNANSATTTAGSAVGAATAVYTDVTIEGGGVVNAAGTITVQAAQNVSDATATTVAVNSALYVMRVA